MKFVVTDGNQRYTLPRPERYRRPLSAAVSSFDIIGLGEAKIPRGRSAITVGWSGTFWGEPRARSVIGAVFDVASPAVLTAPLPLRDTIDWRMPDVFVVLFDALIATGRKINLKISDTLPGILDALTLGTVTTGSAIDLDCFVYQFETDRGGGFGDVRYTIEFAEWRDLSVRLTSGTGAAIVPDHPSRYIVRQGDTLWGIAKQNLGDALRWNDIYTANLTVVGNNPNLIFPGQILNIPAA